MKIDQEPSFENSVCADQNFHFKDYILTWEHKWEDSCIQGFVCITVEDALHCAVYWECELSQKDSTWQRMFQANPKINLFPICKEYFQKVKQDMNDEELFNHWLKKQKLKYPHHLAYQNINLWSYSIFKWSFHFIPTLSFWGQNSLPKKFSFYYI